MCSTHNTALALLISAFLAGDDVRRGGDTALAAWVLQPAEGGQGQQRVLRVSLSVFACFEGVALLTRHFSLLLQEREEAVCAAIWRAWRSACLLPLQRGPPGLRKHLRRHWLGRHRRQLVHCRCHQGCVEGVFISYQPVIVTHPRTTFQAHLCGSRPRRTSNRVSFATGCGRGPTPLRAGSSSMP